MNKKAILKKVFTGVFFAAMLFMAVWVVFHDQDPAQMLASLKQFNAWWLIPAAVLAIGYVSCEGHMIWFMMEPGGDLRAMPRCIGYAFINFFFSGITPSASGGQPAQLIYMRRDGYSVPKSCATLTVIAAFNKLVLAAAGAVLLIVWNAPLNAFFQDKMGYYYLGLGILVFWVVFLGAIVLVPEWMEKAILWLMHLLEKMHLLKPSQKRDDAIIHFFDGYRDIRKTVFENMPKVLIIALVSVLQRAMLVFLTCLVYLGYGLSGTSLLTVFALQLAVMITVDMLPLPGAQGISEVIYTAVFGSIFTEALVRPSVCITRLMSFYLLLLLSLAVIFVLGLKKKRSPEAAERAPE